MCKGGEGRGALELILFVTSTGAIYLCFSAGASWNTGWGEEGCEWGSFRPRCIQLGPKLGSGSTTSRMAGFDG